MSSILRESTALLLLMVAAVTGAVVPGLKTDHPAAGDGFTRRVLRVVLRRRRDGVGFYIGEPCENTCNSILFHVYCNRTSGRCECHDQYPVNIGNRLCVKAARLGDNCEYDDACAFYDENAVCPSGSCRCADGFNAADSAALKNALCLPASTVTFLEHNYLMTTLSAIGGLVIFTALLCLVLRLFSKARFHRPEDRMATAGSPPTMMSAYAGSNALDSRRASRSSGSTDFLPASRRASYSMLAPPSSLGSRRPSSTSVRSQLSFRTQSSFRGYRWSREPVRRALSSPAESSTHHCPPSPCKVPSHQQHHHHHVSHHPVHHNSPVDEDDIIDIPTMWNYGRRVHMCK